MHLRKLILVCGFAVMLLANYTNALGLGEIKLNSSLNQPLNAEIKLLDVRDLTPDQIIVALGSPADFERNGVDRLFFYSEFNFEVSLNSPGGAVVRITTRSPVREPYLNFLIEARWSTGRLLREYTLLMDLPTFGDTPAAPVESTTSSSQQRSQPRAASNVKTPARQAEAYVAPESRESAAPSDAPARESRRSAGTNSYGPIGANDTLWQIALDVRPDRNLSVHQTMLALQRLNPEAFINGNINLLKKGQVLRLPSAEDIRSISRDQAVTEVAHQNRDWSDNTLGAPLNASRREDSAPSEREAVSGRVKLASPGSDNGSSGQGSGGNTGDGKALESELTGALEELDKTRSENTELTSRVRDLEEQIETMERLVEVSNEQLRAMQLAANQQTANDSSAAADSPLSAQETASSAAIDSLNDSSASPETGEPVADSSVSAPAASEPAVVEPVKPPVDTNTAPVRDVTKTIPAPPKSLMDQVMDNILWIVLGLLIVLGIIYAIVRRRKESAESGDDSNGDDNIFTMPDQTYEPYGEDSLDETSPDLEAEEMALLDDESGHSTEAETGDVVGEADIYIAYGKFDQAEEMLLNGLRKEPESVDIRLKLLEVYSQTQELPKFDTYYASLIGLASHGALQRAAELRENIAGAAPFEADIQPAQDESIDLAASEDTLDFGLDDEVYAESTEIADNKEEEDEFSFDLDLDDDISESADDDQPLEQTADLGKSSSRYDLSFEEEQVVENELADEFTLDFDSEEAISIDEVEDQPSSIPGNAIVLEDNPDELSFELDEDEELLTADVASVEEEAEEEFNFDFDDELEESVETEDFAFEEDEPAALLQNVNEDNDDFNLDMEMGDLDLEALDHEMESLDAEFGASDEKDVVSSEEDLEDDFQEAPVQRRDEVLEAELPEDEEDVFAQALSDFSAPAPDHEPGEDSDAAEVSADDMDAELDFLADTDEAATKLDLARAYIDMGDTDGAKDILAEVASEGNPEQRNEAKELLERIEA